jgi:glyoxylase-like metal-dependent hydrolase (beta-lactamase superfamily II)
VTRNLAFYDLVLAGDPRFVPLDTLCWLTSEVEIVSTAGHTQGHRSVVAHGVELEDGGFADVLIAGDAVPGGEIVKRASAAEIPLVADSALYWRTRRSLLDRYRYIIPGHGTSISNGSRLAAGARS